jgi:O-antigen ligase
MAFFLAASGIAFFIVYRMQSRGAVLGGISALLFGLVTSSRLRRYALPLAVFTLVAASLLESPAVLSSRFTDYLMRGQTDEQFRSMTGRTGLYAEGLAAFEDAPIMGRGQWADRLVGIGHVHNSYLEALLDAGILGAIPYVASWIAGWVLFFRLQNKSRLLLRVDRLALLEAGTVMMFFAVRSIPETTTASFSVDLLVMAAIYVYFEMLTMATARRRFRERVWTPVLAGTRENQFCPQILGRTQLTPDASRQ